MPLLPSLKEKKRYIAFEIIAKEKFGFKDVKAALEKALLTYIGLLGTAKAGLQVFPELYQDNQGLVRVEHQFDQHFKASLVLIDQINNQKAVVRSVGSSGILKKAQEKYLR